MEINDQDRIEQENKLTQFIIDGIVMNDIHHKAVIGAALRILVAVASQTGNNKFSIETALPREDGSQLPIVAEFICYDKPEETPL